MANTFKIIVVDTVSHKKVFDSPLKSEGQKKEAIDFIKFKL
jgi:hypothetical protein